MLEEQHFGVELCNHGALLVSQDSELHHKSYKYISLTRIYQNQRNKILMKN